MNGADERWAQAQALLDGVASEAAHRRLRRGQRRLLVGAVVGLAVGLAVVLLLLGGSDAGGSDDEPAWRTVTGLVVMLAGFVIAVPSTVRFLRDVRMRDQWRTPLLALDLGQRRELVRQVNGQSPADPAHLPLARHLAESLVRQTLPPRMLLGLLVLVVGQLIGSPSWWSVVGLLGVGLAWASSLRTAGRARAFLAAHPEQPPA